MDTVACATLSPSLGEDYLTRLPSELLLIILFLLPLYERLCIRLTCRRLHSLASDPSLWQHVTWKHFVQSDDKLLKVVLKISSPHLRKIELISASGQFGNYSEFTNLLMRCKYVHSLSLCGFQVDQNQVEALIQAMPWLSHMRIDLLMNNRPKQVFAAAKFLRSLIIGLPTDMHRHATQHAVNLIWILRVWAQQGCYPADLGLINKEFTGGSLDDCYFSGNFYGLKLREIQCNHKARLCLYVPGMPMKLTPLQPVFEVSLPYSPVLACGKPLGLSSCFVLSQRPLGSEHYSRAHCCRSTETVSPLHKQSFTLFAQHITSLKLEGSNLTCTHLEAIATACPNLTDLDIAHCTDAL